MTSRWSLFLSALVAASLVSFGACGQRRDETRPPDESTGGEVHEAGESEDLGEEIEDEIIEDAEGPFE